MKNYLNVLRFGKNDIVAPSQTFREIKKEQNKRLNNLSRDYYANPKSQMAHLNVKNEFFLKEINRQA